MTQTAYADRITECFHLSESIVPMQKGYKLMTSEDSEIVVIFWIWIIWMGGSFGSSIQMHACSNEVIQGYPKSTDPEVVWWAILDQL